MICMNLFLSIHSLIYRIYSVTAICQILGIIIRKSEGKRKAGFCSCLKEKNALLIAN